MGRLEEEHEFTVLSDRLYLGMVKEKEGLRMAPVFFTLHNWVKVSTSQTPVKTDSPPHYIVNM